MHLFYTNTFGATKILHSGSVGTTPSFYKQPFQTFQKCLTIVWIAESILLIN